MQQHLKRQDGVEKVEVNLVDGKVVIFRKEDSKFDPSAIFKAVYDSGVSVSEMIIIAGGEVVRDGSTLTGLTFKIGNSLSFPVRPNAVAKKLAEPGSVVGAVRLRGLLYKKPAGKRPKTPDTSQIEILEILK